MISLAPRLIVHGGLLSLAAMIGMLIPSLAQAHCWPIEQTPSAGARLRNAPREIRIRFSERITEEGSTLRLSREGGEPLKTGPARRPDDESDVLTISLPGLSPGHYHVYWTARTFDGHDSEGDYSFELE